MLIKKHNYNDVCSNNFKENDLYTITSLDDMFTIAYLILREVYEYTKCGSEIEEGKLRNKVFSIVPINESYYDDVFFDLYKKDYLYRAEWYEGNNKDGSRIIELKYRITLDGVEFYHNNPLMRMARKLVEWREESIKNTNN